MRKDVKKILILGMESERQEFFRKVQEAGIVEFINSHETKVAHPSKEVQDLMLALKILRSIVPVKQTDPGDVDFADKIVPPLLNAHQSLEQLREEKRLLSQEIVRVAPFGDFSKAMLEALQQDGRCVVQFYHAKQTVVDTSGKDYDNLIWIAVENGLDYFVGINKEKRNYPGLIEMPVDRPLGELKSRLAEVDGEMHVRERQLKEFNQYNAYLHRILLVKLDEYHLSEAKGFVSLVVDHSLFAVEGWIPENKLQQIRQLTGGSSVIVEETALEEHDRIPTYLENTGAARLGEDLVKIYDTPSNTDRDPSLWVLWAFALFFAMIIGDAGYGLLFLIATLYCRYKFKPKKGALSRFLKLSTLVFASCLVWGVLIGSFFGIELSPAHPLREYSLTEWLAKKELVYHIQANDSFWKEASEKYKLETKDPTQIFQSATAVVNGKVAYALLDSMTDTVMFELALFIGTIHVMLSLLRYVNRHFSAIGWVIFMVGGYLYFPYMLKATSIVNAVFGVHPELAGKLGLQLIYVGIGLAVVLALIQHKLGGLHEIMNVVQIFGDVLSYLRLYALGLAGAIVAKTFNQMGESAGWIFGPLIIICGHVINIVLGLMSGVIHGLRLNFLEWYHYSFEGGGRLFQPLRLLQREE